MTTAEPPTRGELTVQQRRVLHAIATHYRKHGLPPTVREVMGAMGFQSPNAVVCHLKPLARAGWIVWAPQKQGDGSKARGIVVPEIAAAVATAAGAYLEGLA